MQNVPETFKSWQNWLTFLNTPWAISWLIIIKTSTEWIAPLETDTELAVSFRLLRFFLKELTSGNYFWCNLPLEDPVPGEEGMHLFVCRVSAARTAQKSSFGASEEGTYKLWELGSASILMWPKGVCLKAVWEGPTKRSYFVFIK